MQNKVQWINPAPGPQDRRIPSFSIFLDGPHTWNVDGKPGFGIFMDQTVQLTSNSLGTCCSPQKTTDLSNPSAPSVWARKSFQISCYSSSLLLGKGVWVKCYTSACRQTSWPIKLSKLNTCGNSVLFMAKRSQFSWRKLESVVCHLKKTCSLRSGLYATFLKLL